MTVSRKVLLVGDDKATLGALEKLAVSKAYAVETVAGGEDALWLFDDGEHETVFTDLDLRGISGVEVAEGIRARHPDMPVVVFSARDSRPDRERVEAAGAEFWLKSQTHDQLAPAVARVLQAAEAAAKARPGRPKTSQSAALVLERLRNVLLFVLAPIIALGYIIAFPIIGFGALVWLAKQAFEKKSAEAQPAEAQAGAAASPQGWLKTAGMLVVALVLGVFYGIIGPVFGFLLVIYFAFEAWGRLGAKAIKATET